MILCIDIGNTATKIAIFNDKDIVNKNVVSTNKKIQEGEFIKHLNGFNEVSKIVFSSVVPEINNIVKKDIREKFKNIPFIEIGPGVKTGVNIAVPHPKEVGSDIVAQVVGACEVSNKAKLIVGLGTATVFILADDKNRIVGASFTPGIELSMKSLSVATSKLTLVELSDIKSDFGTDTQSAIVTGIIFSAVGAISKMIDIAKQKLGNDIDVIISGGYYDVLKSHIDIDVQHIDELTIRGLRKIGELNE